VPFEFNGKLYRSYKHPILEYILTRALESSSNPPDTVPFTYEDIYKAMDALGMSRPQQASYSNFVIDLLRKANTIEQRVPKSVEQRGYDLERIPDREVRKNYAGRLIRLELKAKEPWVVWEEFSDEDVIIIPNTSPNSIQPYLSNDEGALLSIMDYCDVLSQALTNTSGTIKRVQHPKKWQPGEIDGLYLDDTETPGILYPVEVKALSTNDNVNVAQIESAFRTIKKKISGIKIVPLAVQMAVDGMLIAVFEETPTGTLIITRSIKVRIEPPIEAWQKLKGKE
jgi:hypothetical protein